MQQIKVVGMDPSMSNWAFNIATLDLLTESFEINELILAETSPSKIKAIRKNSDDLRRAKEIEAHFDYVLDGARFAFVEVPHGSQSARAMASYGMCIGLLASVKSNIIQLTEREVKLGSIGKSTATKLEMIEWAYGHYPNAPWIKNKKGGLLGKNEHLADATATIHAGIKSDQFQSILSVLNAKAA